MLKESELSRLHIGTSGWSYKHWSGIFYPEGIKSAKFLEYYITQFECVELNASFYYPPGISTVDGWMKRTPDNFIFCPKMSRFVTHLRRLETAESSVINFFEVFRAMKNRMGPVLIQLPPGLKYDAALLNEFLWILKEKYGEYRFAIEIRNWTWICDEFFSRLEDCGIAFVIADSGKRFPYYEAITSDFVYIRFHGPNKLYASNYGDWELKEYAFKIINWLKRGMDVWAFFNNDFEGYAVKNAMKLRVILSSL